MPKLEFVFLNDTEITDLTPLRTLPALHTVYLKNNPLTDESLAVLEELKERQVRIVEPRASVPLIKADRKIVVTINGKPISFEQPPVFHNQTTIVQMRPIYEALGATLR